jgi:hypothetical protein
MNVVGTLFSFYGFDLGLSFFYLLFWVILFPNVLGLEIFGFDVRVYAFESKSNMLSTLKQNNHNMLSQFSSTIT